MEWAVIFAVVIVVAIVLASLIPNDQLREKIRTARANRILSKTDEWGEENCRALVAGRIAIGMTKDMVREALPVISSWQLIVALHDSILFPTYKICPVQKRAPFST